MMRWWRESSARLLDSFVFLQLLALDDVALQVSYSERGSAFEASFAMEKNVPDALVVGAAIIQRRPAIVFHVGPDAVQHVA